MKKYLIISLLLISGSAIAQEGEPVFTPPPMEEVVQKDTILEIVDEQAQFPGGKEQLYKFLGDNLQYPQSAIAKNLQGKCYIRFVVDTKGNVSNVKIMKGVPNCPECNAEAIRVVKKMPQWIPGKVKGKTVNMYYNLPITFRLDK